LNFVSEITWPGRIEIGTGVKHIGRSSVTLEQALFQDGRCAATATTVIVQMNETTRRSQPLDDAAKAFLAGLIVRDAPTASS
jgi:acyl-CoA thioester hydrolase